MNDFIFQLSLNYKLCIVANDASFINYLQRTPPSGIVVARVGFEPTTSSI